MKLFKLTPALLLVMLSACQTTGLGLGTTVFNPLKYQAAVVEAENIPVSTVIRSTSEFMVDKRNETTSVKGHLLRTKYSDYHGKVVAFIGYDEDAATLQGSIFSGVAMQQSRENARRYFSRGGVGCVLNNKNHEKYALKIPYAKEVTVSGTVTELIDGWVYLENCQFSSGKASPEFKKPANLDFIAGRWCAISTGFMNRNVQWKVDYTKVAKNQFQASYLYAANYSTGWQNKGVETFNRNGKQLTREGADELAGRFSISDKVTMFYYPNAGDNKNMHMFLKCQ